MYFGFDESGSKPTFLVVSWTDNADYIEPRSYGKKRKTSAVINENDNYKFALVPELKAGRTERRIKEIACLAYYSNMTSEDNLYVDAFRNPLELTTMLLEELSKYNIILDRFKLQAGHKFDQKYKIVNDADRIAIILSRSFDNDELHKYADKMVQMKLK